MNTQSILQRRPLAMMAIALLYAGTSLAQTPLDTRDLPAPEVHKGGCADVIWHTDLVQKYPRIASGCQEVVLVNGEKWARFEGDFMRNNTDGSFTTEFTTTSGRSLGRVTLMPTPDQRVTLDGRKVRFTELRAGQPLNFYLPEGEAGFALEPAPTTEPYVRIVRYEDQVADESEPMRLAQVDPTPARAVPRLPDTAGPLPALALGGLLSLFGGAGLTLRRRRLQRTDRQASC